LVNLVACHALAAAIAASGSVPSPISPTRSGPTPHSLLLLERRVACWSRNSVASAAKSSMGGAVVVVLLIDR
jgi:hypothetical protein